MCSGQSALRIIGENTVVYGHTLQLGTEGGSGMGAVTYAVTSGTGEAVLYHVSSGGSGGGGGTTRYTVSFETNGGSKISNQTAAKNSAIKEPTAPTKEGFDFAGWYADKELKTKYDFSEKVTKNFMLYAAWTEKDKSENQIILTIGEMEAKVFG